MSNKQKAYLGGLAIYILGVAVGAGAAKSDYVRVGGVYLIAGVVCWVAVAGILWLWHNFKIVRRVE